MIKFIKRNLKYIIVGIFIYLLTLLIIFTYIPEEPVIECPICETCEICEKCECECDCMYDIACEALGHCPESPKTYKQELVETQTLLENCQLLNKKFRPLTYVMMTTFGTWKYNTKDYNCVDFSKEFQMKLRKAGIESSVVYGNIPESTDKVKHSWIAVWVEPISGNFVKPEDNYKVIKILK